MIRAFEKAFDCEQRGAPLLTLPFDLRQRSRFTATLDTGEPIAVSLARGTRLRDGDYLRTEANGDVHGSIIRVRAALEEVSTAHAPTAIDLARACYHLGNRHTPLQIGPTWVRYLSDHVLDDMLLGFGLAIVHEQSPFEPESGAYAAGHAAHHDH